MEASIELSLFAIDILNRKGPVTVYTGIAQHNLFLEEELSPEKYEELCESDIIKIGKSGKNINKSDLRAFFEDLKSRKDQEIFNNDRTYIFEGVTKNEKTSSYWIDWGS